MAAITKIQWTDHTFNPWRGCSKVHAGCTNCYAERNYSVKMHGIQWGPNGTRAVTSVGYWMEPRKWNRDAQAAGERRRVFCASLADVFEDWDGEVLDHKGCAHYTRDDFPDHVVTNEQMMGCDSEGYHKTTLEDCRNRLFQLIDDTPHLDWLLLTKRPENIRRMWPAIISAGRMMAFTDEGAAAYGVVRGEMTDCNVSRGNSDRDNVWLGTSVSDQATADKMVPELLKCRDLAPVLFLSCEPLLGPIEFSNVSKRSDAASQWGKKALTGIDWVIVGGESGPQSRPCDPQWLRSISRQCKAVNVPCFVKQLGGNIVTRNDCVEDQFNNLDNGWPDPAVEYDIHGYREHYQGADCRVHLRDSKGGDPDEWPEDLRVREFPAVNLRA